MRVSERKAKEKNQKRRKEKTNFKFQSHLCNESGWKVVGEKLSFFIHLFCYYSEYYLCLFVAFAHQKLSLQSILDVTNILHCKFSLLSGRKFFLKSSFEKFCFAL